MERTRTSNRQLTAVALVVAIIALGGCRSSQTVPTTPPTLQLLKLSVATTAINAATYFEPNSFSLQFVVLNEDGTVASPLVLTRSNTIEHGASFVDSEGDRSHTYWKFDEHGNAVMTAHIDHVQRSLTLFDPPIVIAFAVMQPSETYTSESAMRIVDSRNPQRLREMGRGKRTMTYIGDQSIVTPDGEFTAHRIESTFIADLRFADATEHVVRFYSPVNGLLAEQSTEEVKVLGTLSTTKRRTIVRSVVER